MSPFSDPEILLDKIPIKVVTEAKFLGLVFDYTLSFKSHIQYMKTSCQKALDTLRDTLTGDQIIKSCFDCTDHWFVPNWIADALYMG